MRLRGGWGLLEQAGGLEALHWRDRQRHQQRRAGGVPGACRCGVGAGDHGTRRGAKPAGMAGPHGLMAVPVRWRCSSGADCCAMEYLGLATRGQALPRREGARDRRGEREGQRCANSR